MDVRTPSRAAGRGGADLPTEDAIVLAAVSRFGSDRVALERFLDATGYDVRAIRTGLADGSLRPGVLHYLAGDEEFLLAVAADMAVPPEALAAAVLRSVSPDEDRPVSAGSARRASASGPRVRPRG